jgi:hypothetical protein
MLKIAMEFIDSITYELLAHLNEVKLYASNDHRIAIDKLCNELKENINQTITIASSLLSKPARSRGEIYKMYDRVKVLSRKALSKLDEETLKGINELMCEINMERFIKLIPNEITKTITSLQKIMSSAMNYITSNEQRIEICKTYEEQMNRFIMKLQLAITLYMLILWYKPFEKKISQLRYPNHKMKHNPININENTTLTQWAKMIIEKINEMDMLKCIKELVKEKIESQKCRETLEFLKNDMINASSITSLQM